MFAQVFFARAKMFTETDFRPELRKISVPALLIHGDNDTSTPIETTERKTAPLISVVN
jgi:non-heme chloroperoxidase